MKMKYYFKVLNKNTSFVGKTQIIFLFCAICCFFSCKSPQKSANNSLHLEVFKLDFEGPEYYFFRTQNELIHFFYNDVCNLDSICKYSGINIDSTFSIDIVDRSDNFDTIYYANYSYERIIFDRISVLLTRNQCFVHSCLKVGQVNDIFKLEEEEIRILDYLISECDLTETNRNKNIYFDENYSVNYRIRVVNKKNKECDLYLSDTHKSFKKYALLNSYILGLTNKYIFKSQDTETPVFLVPAW